MTAPWALRRPRMCEAVRAARTTRLARAWDLLRHGHTHHICDRQRSFAHEHIGRHICTCGVKWA